MYNKHIIAQEKEYIVQSTLSEHIIYSAKIEHLYGDPEEYIGVTIVSNGNIGASLRKRWNQHVRTAKTLKKNWKLSKAIRKYGKYAFDFEILEVVKGKQKAHKIERCIIRERKPSLNTDLRSSQEKLDEMKYFVFETTKNERTVWLDKNHECIYDENSAKVFGEYEAKRLLKFFKKYNKSCKWELKKTARICM